LFVDLKILTIVNLYIFSVLLYTKVNLSDLQQRGDIHSHMTRNSKKLDLPYHRLSKSSNSYTVIGMKIYNKLPDKLVKEPLKMFKKKLFDWLVSRPFYSLQEFFESTVDI
jgi:hypothetical protein